MTLILHYYQKVIITNLNEMYITKKSQFTVDYCSRLYVQRAEQVLLLFNSYNYCVTSIELFMNHLLIL